MSDYQYGTLQLTETQKESIRKKLSEILSYEPRVGVFGKTGVGKSSLCNALFGRDICPISDVEACTRNPQEELLHIGENMKGLKLVDVPGVGESQDRDEEYAKLYSKLLPELDVVLWVLKADDRAYASDETFYKNIVRPHIDEGKAFFFVLNQVDRIEPFEAWNLSDGEPGAEQFLNIDRKTKVVADFFQVAASKIIPVSARRHYGLSTLVDEIIFALPKEKKVTMFRQVSDECKSAAAGEHVKQAWYEVVGSVVCNVIETVADAVERIADAAKDLWETIKPSWWPF